MHLSCLRQAYVTVHVRRNNLTPPWHQTTTCLHDPVHSWKVHTSTSKDHEAFWQCHRASAQELHPGLLCLCTTRRQHARLKRPRRSQQRSNQNSKLWSLWQQLRSGRSMNCWKISIRFVKLCRPCNSITAGPGFNLGHPRSCKQEILFGEERSL